jgi:hypothetical protein
MGKKDKKGGNKSKDDGGKWKSYSKHNIIPWKGTFLKKR